MEALLQKYGAEVTGTLSGFVRRKGRAAQAQLTFLVPPFPAASKVV